MKLSSLVIHVIDVFQEGMFTIQQNNEMCEWEKKTDDGHWYCEQCEAMRTFNIGWLQKMHDMIDALAEGKSIEEYLAKV